MPLNVLAIGASRNTGYLTAAKLLGAGATVTFMLRTTAVFDADAALQSHITAGRAHLVQGDALMQEDVARAWAAAASTAPVDVLPFTVGGIPRFQFREGFVLDPPNYVTQCLLNALCTLPAAAPAPRIVALSATVAALGGPQRDKRGVERVLAHVGDRAWDADAAAVAVGEEMLGTGWEARAGLPARGAIPRVLVVRSALLTDDASAAENGGMYRVGEELSGAWSISRGDVAHFLAETILRNWEVYEGRCVTIAY